VPLDSSDKPINYTISLSEENSSKHRCCVRDRRNNCIHHLNELIGWGFDMIGRLARTGWNSDAILNTIIIVIQSSWISLIDE
jgi:hypothetical protein